jgi:hypothetical protein
LLLGQRFHVNLIPSVSSGWLQSAAACMSPIVHAVQLKRPGQP